MSFQLSVVIITKNEEQNIDRCLRSLLTVADDIVIVDSGSTDKTEEISNHYRVNFIKAKWNGYSETKNFANKQAKYDWILSIDADEELSPELQRSIQVLKRISDGINGKMKRLTNYCGTWIWHGGWYPDIKLRIFNRNQACWEGELHEKLVFSESQDEVLLDGKCFHYTVTTIWQHIEIINKYSSIWAEERYIKGRKASMIKVVFSPFVRFLKDYFFKKGVLDGFFGFVIAMNTSYSGFLRLVKLRQLYLNERFIQKNVSP